MLVLWIVTILYAAACVGGVWWSLFAGHQGLTMAIVILFLVGSVVLIIAAQVLSARRRY